MSQTSRLNDSFAAAEQAEHDADFCANRLDPRFDGLFASLFPALRTAKAEPVRVYDTPAPWDEKSGVKA